VIRFHLRVVVRRERHRHQGQSGYTTAKHRVIDLTRATALYYAAQNIRINAVCPGYIDISMMGRFTGGTPESRAKVPGAPL
jgi:NAD(P)-dependent dehydrogenase (short-subunit alcohol dehydrogenase family)